MKIRETKIVERLIGYCYDNNLRYRTEVPFFLNKIDLVSINPKNGDVIAVEAKVSNWNRAVQQATSYSLCANKVYLALWHEYAHRVDVDVLNHYGIGLMSVNGNVEVLHHAKKSKLANKSMLDQVKTLVLNSQYS
jgi:hypothetical protein